MERLQKQLRIGGAVRSLEVGSRRLQQKGLRFAGRHAADGLQVLPGAFDDVQIVVDENGAAPGLGFGLHGQRDEVADGRSPARKFVLAGNDAVKGVELEKAFVGDRQSDEALEHPARKGCADGFGEEKPGDARRSRIAKFPGQSLCRAGGRCE